MGCPPIYPLSIKPKNKTYFEKSETIYVLPFNFVRLPCTQLAQGLLNKPTTFKPQERQRWFRFPNRNLLLRGLQTRETYFAAKQHTPLSIFTIKRPKYCRHLKTSKKGHYATQQGAFCCKTNLVVWHNATLSLCVITLCVIFFSYVNELSAYR
jgi:hypothetical protein